MLKQQEINSDLKIKKFDVSKTFKQMHCRNTPGIVLSSLKEKSTGDPNMFKHPGFRKQDQNLQIPIRWKQTLIDLETKFNVSA